MNTISFPALLEPFKTSAICAALNVHGDSVRAWRRGEATPSIEKLPALAEFLKIDIGELVLILAKQTKVVRHNGPSKARSTARPATRFEEKLASRLDEVARRDHPQKMKMRSSEERALRAANGVA